MKKLDKEVLASLNPTEKVYRIEIPRNEYKNPEYSTGGVKPWFRLQGGKIWRLCNLRLHLRQFIGKYGRPSDYPLPEKYLKCDIVEYELKEVRRIKLSDYIEEGK
jgi:hypothetical protein